MSRTLIKDIDKYILATLSDSLNDKDVLKNISNNCKMLLDRWINSSCTDFSIYEDKAFSYNAINCYLKYSKRHIRMFFDKYLIANDNVYTIVDFGGGIGATSLLLYYLYKYYNKPIRILYYNLPGFQFTFAERLFKECGTDIRVCNTFDDLGKFDCAICFEYLEHFKNPLIEIDRICSTDIKVLAHVSSFSVFNIGHFKIYDVSEKARVSCYDIMRIANKRIKEHGFNRSSVRFFNDEIKIFERCV